MDNGRWSEFSPSMQNALRFARAAAGLRPAPSLPSEVQEADLLVGMILSHPDSSDPQVFFSNYGLVAGQALPEDYPLVTADNLNQQLSQVDQDELPALSDELESILDLSYDMGVKSRDGKVHMHHVWANFLFEAADI